MHECVCVLFNAHRLNTLLFDTLGWRMAVSGSVLKYASLIVLVIQNTALVLTLRYSRKGTEGQPMYIVSTAVVMTEATKFFISLSIFFYNNEMDIVKTLSVLKEEIIEKFSDTIKLSVPAILYTIQNNLLYVALSNLDAATFQVFSSSILSTLCYVPCSIETNLPHNLLDYQTECLIQ